MFRYNSVKRMLDMIVSIFSKSNFHPTMTVTLVSDICIINLQPSLKQDFPAGSDGKASAYNAEDLGSIPGSGRSPG